MGSSALISLSSSHSGCPQRLVWTREEQGGYTGSHGPLKAITSGGVSNVQHVIRHYYIM